jgi:hypothetical protein
MTGDEEFHLNNIKPNSNGGAGNPSHVSILLHAISNNANIYTPQEIIVYGKVVQLVTLVRTENKV